MRGGSQQACGGLRVKRADHLGRRAHHQGAFGDFLAFRHQGAGADDAARANTRAIHHSRPHANQSAIANGAAMQNSMMPNGHISADRQWKTHIGMQHGTFLDIAARADADGFIVTTDHGAKPNAHIFGQDHMAHHLRIGRHPKAALAGCLGHKIIKRVDRHGGYPSGLKYYWDFQVFFALRNGPRISALCWPGLGRSCRKGSRSVPNCMGRAGTLARLPSLSVTS